MFKCGESAPLDSLAGQIPLRSCARIMDVDALLLTMGASPRSGSGYHFDPNGAIGLVGLRENREFWQI